MVKRIGKQIVDVRPDRMDLRDLPYRAPLRSLPPVYPDPHEAAALIDAYLADGMILDQGSEGACTGFGLAATINYTLWLLARETGAAPGPRVLVSPWMLYDNARLHDEWDGEDYDGSSCRGAMKGWHKHGVCALDLWPGAPTAKRAARPGWQQDAARRPLGSYYRVDARSLADLQAAIREVKAVYVSAAVHDGWDRPAAKFAFGHHHLAVITGDPTATTGGHAFALVGYTDEGFIVQNSWGPDWGTHGFALMRYEDWVINGHDAWVAALGAPVLTGAAPPDRAARGGGALMLAAAMASPAVAAPRGPAQVEPWDAATAYEHCIVLANNGGLIRRIPDVATAEAALARVVVDNVAASGASKVVVYAHGGLNAEEDALMRARRMGPWFVANGIHPIFVVWRTGILEAIGQIGADIAEGFLKELGILRARAPTGWFEVLKDRIAEKRDRAFEVAAERLVGTSVWTKIKDNAAAASAAAGGLALAAAHLRDWRAADAGRQWHALGHSAGANLLGHFLGRFTPETGPATLGLYAPACTVDFAVQKFGRALDQGVLPATGLAVDLLSDARELDDTVGTDAIYGKSLLYLVSRALEKRHKTALLGLERAWVGPGDTAVALAKTDLADVFAREELPALVRWAGLAAAHGLAAPVVLDAEKVVTGPTPQHTIAAGHGSFDNDVEVVNRSIARILGKAPPVPVTDLTSF